MNFFEFVNILFFRPNKKIKSTGETSAVFVQYLLVFSSNYQYLAVVISTSDHKGQNKSY
jgi:hypothetical protein